MKKRETKEEGIRAKIKKRLLKDLYGMTFILALLLGIGFFMRTDQWFSFFIAILVMFYSLMAYRAIGEYPV